MRPLSISTTGTPNAAAAAATERPPAPAPMTHRSGFRVSVMDEPNRGSRRTGCLEMFQQHWNEGQQPKNDKRSNQPRRCQRLDIKAEPTAFARGRDAGAIGREMLIDH